jgi:hypothetical protein
MPPAWLRHAFRASAYLRAQAKIAAQIAQVPRANTLPKRARLYPFTDAAQFPSAPEQPRPCALWHTQKDRAAAELSPPQRRGLLPIRRLIHAGFSRNDGGL